MREGQSCCHPMTRKILVTKDVTFDENRFFYSLNTRPTAVGMEPEEKREAVRMEIPTLDTVELGDTTQFFEQPEEDIRQDETKPPPANTFPKFDVMRKSKLPSNITQPQPLDEEITPQEDILTEEQVEEFYP